MAFKSVVVRYCRAMLQELLKPKSREGFALVVVLFTLAVLTVLLSVASSRTMNHLQHGALQRQIAENEQTNRDLLELAMRHLSEHGSTPFTVNGQEVLFFQDVAGLIDLNTANPAVREVLFADLTESQPQKTQAIEAYLRWRQQDRRLVRIDDLPRITGLPWSAVSRLEEIATVHSGRTGIAPEVAPLSVLELVTGTTGQHDQLTKLIPAEFVAQKSNVNFRVYSADRRFIGVVHASGGGNSRIIEIR